MRRTLEEGSATLLWAEGGGGADCAEGASVSWVPKRAELRVRPGTTGGSALPLICGCVCRKEGAREGPAGVGGAVLSDRGAEREETRRFLSGLQIREESKCFIVLFCCNQVKCFTFLKKSVCKV